MANRPTLVRYSSAVLAWLTPLLIIFDTINGFLLRSGAPSISQPIKVIFLGLLVIFAAHYKRGLSVLCACIISNLLFLFCHFLMLGTSDVLIADLQWLLRFNIAWIGCFVFQTMYEQGTIQQRWVLRTFVFVSVILTFNLALGTLGYGYSQYGKFSDNEQIGAVGFIYAGNEMSFLLLVCQIVICGHLYNKRSSVIAYTLVSVIFLVLSILKATKVAMLGSVLVSLWFPSLEAARAIRNMKLKSYRLVLFAILGGVAIIVMMPWLTALVDRVGIMGRINYFVRENGLMFALFSGREDLVAKYFSAVWPKYDVVQYIVGVGRFSMLASLNERPVEIDLVDILGSFGFLGVILYYGFFFVKSAPSLRAFRRVSDGGDDVVLALVFFALVISMTAGHVIYSGLAIPYMAVVLGLYTHKTRNRKIDFLRQSPT